MTTYRKLDDHSAGGFALRVYACDDGRAEERQVFGYADGRVYVTEGIFSPFGERLRAAEPAAAEAVACGVAALFDRVPAVNLEAYGVVEALVNKALATRMHAVA